MLLNVEKIAPIDIHWHLMNVYRDQTVDVISVRLWVVYFSNDVVIVAVKPWVTSTGAGFCECSMHAVVHLW